MPLLEIHDLRVEFGAAAPVDGVSLSLAAGRTLGLVGESGCGKTLTALAVMGLVPPSGRVAGGRVMFAGRDLLALDERAMREVRGGAIGMVFQEPMTALNPVLTVGAQIAEVAALHGAGRGAAWARAVEMLRLVEIPDPERRADAYPHQLSGGMRQRVMLAMALACRPQLLIADEPTTALDVTIQAQVLDLLAALQRRLGMAVLLVTHDLGVVAERADEIAIMYAGRIVETGDATAVLATPAHPYTRGLVASVPAPGRRSRLEAIPGSVPDPAHLPSGCRFRDRCRDAIAECAQVDPPLRDVGAGRRAACIRIDPAPTPSPSPALPAGEG
ncbi:MAG TPA: ABC transporter ATP-binding protein [Candidatus Dormibacteraeota bacterium]|nr:ABC transporter ATP-binding protein [Candidatus Dormibacteraeota bacterium]